MVFSILLIFLFGKCLIFSVKSDTILSTSISELAGSEPSIEKKILTNNANKRQEKQFVYYSPTMKKGYNISPVKYNNPALPNSQAVKTIQPVITNNQEQSTVVTVTNINEPIRRFTHLHYNPYYQQKIVPNNIYSYNVNSFRQPIRNNNNAFRQRPFAINAYPQTLYNANAGGNMFRNRAQYFPNNQRVSLSSTTTRSVVTKKKFKPPIVMF